MGGLHPLQNTTSPRSSRLSNTSRRRMARAPGGARKDLPALARADREGGAARSGAAHVSGSHVSRPDLTVIGPQQIDPLNVRHILRHGLLQ